MKIGDLVKIKGHRGYETSGIIISEPRFGVNTQTSDGTTGNMVCEVLFAVSQQVVTRACNDLVAINESR